MVFANDEDMVEPPGTAPGSDPFIPRAFIAIFPEGTDAELASGRGQFKPFAGPDSPPGQDPVQKRAILAQRFPKKADSEFPAMGFVAGLHLPWPFSRRI